MGKDFGMEMNDIIRKGIDRRGLAGIGFPGDLRLSAEALNRSATVMILTGFCVLNAMKGETDGPLGAISLAGALRSLEKRVVIATDVFSLEIMEKGLREKGVSAELECINRGEEAEKARELMDRYKPDHVVSIERTGRAADGRSYSMRGEVLSDIIPQLDIFFDEAHKRGVGTSAVGDGGNEIGMGKVRPDLRTTVHKAHLIWSETRSDHLIVATVSNWGGHALAACLGILNQKELLHDREKERAILSSIVEAGSVDGCTGENVMTVDGLSLEINLGIVSDLRGVMKNLIL